MVLLDEAELQTVLSDINLEQLSVALVDVDQTLFSYVSDNLTQGAKDLVNQYLELKSSSSTPAQVEKARDAIVKMLKNISNKNIVKLNIPTGSPYVFEFNEKFQLIYDEYLEDKDEIAKNQNW